MTLKKGRARRAKAKEARKCVTYQLRPEFAAHLAMKGTDLIVGNFKRQTPEELRKATRYFDEKPPMFHGVIFDYGDKP